MEHKIYMAEAIKEADAIIIGPGSLYTSVIPNLLIKNVAKAIREVVSIASKKEGKRIFVKFEAYGE